MNRLGYIICGELERVTFDSTDHKKLEKLMEPDRPLSGRMMAIITFIGRWDFKEIRQNRQGELRRA